MWKTREFFKSFRFNRENTKEISDLIEEKIELQQQPFIRKAQIKGRKSQDEVRRTTKWQSRFKAKPEWVWDHARVRAKIGIVVFLFLILASYALLFIGFDPYELGIKAHYTCIGIVLATCLMLDVSLTSYYSKKWLLFSLSCTALICLLVAHLNLSLIRAELFKRLGTGSGTFYEETSGLLTLAFPLLAFGIEIAAGLIFFRVIEWLYSPEVRAHKKKEREIKNMIHCDAEINKRRNKSRIMAIDLQLKTMCGSRNRYQREKKLAVLVPIFLFLLIFLLFMAGKAYGADLANDTVILLDLTGSTKRQEFAKNLSAVEKFIKGMDSSSRLTVIGISGSFAEPLLLLQGKTGDKPGYFKEILEQERETLLKEWIEISQKLSPIYKKSPILEMIAIASIVLEDSSAQKKVLLIFSDMLQATEGINFESPSEINPEEMLKKAETLGLIFPLENTEVYVLGVQTYRSPAYFTAVRKFWEDFFTRSGAHLKKYSISREVEK